MTDLSRDPASVADELAKAAIPTSRAARTMRVLGAAMLIGIGGLLPLPWQQSASGTGRVVAFSPAERQQNIEAPIEGRVVEWRVREGTHVRAGDLIVRISDNDPEIIERLREERRATQARLEAIQTRAQSIDARIEMMRSARIAAQSGAQSRVRMAQDRLRAAEQSLEAARAAARTADLNFERQRTLSESGLSSTRTFELAELDRARARTEEQRAGAALSAARSELSAIEADMARVQGDTGAAIDDAQASKQQALADAASTTAELTRIDVRLARQSTMEITAPTDGTIVRLYGGLGREIVRAGDPLAVFVPDNADRAVELWIDGVDVPLLEPGRKVRIQFEGWPAVQFVGWPSVAVGSFGGVVSLIDATDDGKGKFRVLVLPDRSDDAWPSPRYLRQGVRANGWVLLGRVSIAYELWRRFNGFPPIVATQEPGAASSSGQGGK